MYYVAYKPCTPKHDEQLLMDALVAFGQGIWVSKTVITGPFQDNRYVLVHLPKAELAKQLNQVVRRVSKTPVYVHLVRIVAMMTCLEPCMHSQW
jgi:hypothetical protein